MNVKPPMIQVEWLLAKPDHWPPPKAIVSVTLGFQIEETEDEITVAQSSHDGLHAGLVTIHKGAISSIKRLRSGAIL